MPDTTTTTTRPDAILYPAGFRPAGAAGDPADARFAFCQQTLGTARPHVRAYGPTQVFVTADPADSVGFATDHPMHGRDRYDWVDQPGGVKFGTLKPEARV